LTNIVVFITILIDYIKILQCSLAMPGYYTGDLTIPQLLTYNVLDRGYM